MDRTKLNPSLFSQVLITKLLLEIASCHTGNTAVRTQTLFSSALANFSGKFMQSVKSDFIFFSVLLRSHGSSKCVVITCRLELDNLLSYLNNLIMFLIDL